MIVAVWVLALVAGVGIIAWGRKKNKMLIRDIGIGAFVGGFIGLTLHWFELKEVRVLIGDLKSSMITAYYGRLIPPELSEEIGKRIIQDAFYYEEYEVEGTFTDDVDSSGNPDLIRASMNYRYRVRNTSSRADSFPLVSEIIDSSSPKPPGMAQLRVESDRDPSKNIDWVQSDIKRHSSLDTLNNVYRFRKTFRMAAGEALTVSIKSYAYPEKKDYYLIATLHSADGLKMRCDFPEGYTTYCIFNHPAENDTTTCTCKMRSNRVAAEIKSAVLPHQGILVGWSNK